MPNKSYRRGYNFERRVLKFLESNGYFVVRQAKSSFPDLIAINYLGTPIFIECKVNGKLSYKEQKRAEEIVKKYKVPFFIAHRYKRRIVFSPLKKQKEKKSYYNYQKQGIAILSVGESVKHEIQKNPESFEKKNE